MREQNLRKVKFSIFDSKMMIFANFGSPQGSSEANSVCIGEPWSTDKRAWVVKTATPTQPMAEMSDWVPDSNS